MARASSAHRPTSAASNFTKAGLPDSIPGASERPFASTMTASFVDMSPSTVMVLNVSSTALPMAACSTSGAIRASVVTKQSIVAICG